MQQINRLLHGDNPDPREMALTYALGTVSTIFIIAFSLNAGTELSVLQIVVLAVLALDIVGGVIANSTRSTNTWYRERSLGAQFLFLAVHAFHPLVAVLVLDPGNWLYFGFVYLYMLATASVVLMLARTDYQRPVAYGLYIVGLILALYLLNPAPAIVWLAPVYFTKLIVCFAVDHYGAVAKLPILEREKRTAVEA